MKIAIARRAAVSRRGAALLYALLISIVVGGMVSTLFALSLTTQRASEARSRRARAYALAEGAVEVAARELGDAVANWKEPPASGTATIDGVDVDWTIDATGFKEIVTADTGIQTIVDGWRIDATAQLGITRARARRIVNSEATPVFQFAAFYTEDLEILPGPSMELYGRVHTNGDLYLGCGSTLTLNTNYVRAVGNVYRRRKDEPDKSSGTVMIRKWVVNPYDTVFEPEEYVEMLTKADLDALGISSVSGFDSDFVDGFDKAGDGDFDDDEDMLPWGPGAVANWGQPEGYTDGEGETVMTSDHGVKEIATPEIGSITAFEEADPDTGGDWDWDEDLGEYVFVGSGDGQYDKGYYHENAELVVLTKEDGTWSAHDGDGVDVTAILAGHGVVNVTTMFDARQADGAATEIQVTTVDMAKLDGSGVFPDNGLMYVAAYGMGEGTDAHGVRLENGSEIADKLTVVTQNSLYIEGDFNTVDKKGCAVVADAVNLLSNAWDDSKTVGSLPAASDTRYNVAIVTGNQVTDGSDYNGGLENLPRFHEDWSGRTATIQGSFINIWESAYATGTWQYGGDRYTAPNRDWHYDTDFNTVSNLPPYFPMVVAVRDIVSW